MHFTAIFCVLIPFEFVFILSSRAQRLNFTSLLHNLEVKPTEFPLNWFDFANKAIILFIEICKANALTMNSVSNVSSSTSLF